MTVGKLYDYLNKKIPEELSCEWDNDGLALCADREATCKKVLVALDITDEVIDFAARESYDTIVSHHPLFFRPLTAINDATVPSRRALSLLAHGISAMSFHTRLDRVEGGVNDCLAEALGLRDTAPFGDGMGRIGTLAEPVSPEELALHTKTALGAPAVALAKVDRTVLRVAVLGGEGSDALADARLAGADALVSGRLGYHTMTDAAEDSMTLIEAGHYFSERVVLPRLCEWIRELDESLICTVADTHTPIQIL